MSSQQRFAGLVVPSDAEKHGADVPGDDQAQLGVYGHSMGIAVLTREQVEALEELVEWHASPSCTVCVDGCVCGWVCFGGGYHHHISPPGGQIRCAIAAVGYA